MLCGMWRLFAIRTPIAAPVFAMEVVCVGAMRYAALVPCTIASLTASWLADRCGIPLAKYALGDLPAFRVVPALKILLLGVCCCGGAFILHPAPPDGTPAEKALQKSYVRILIASGVIWCWRFWCGTRTIWASAVK
ncbi:MAG: chloride channel protein [Ruminococcus sp.]